MIRSDEISQDLMRSHKISQDLTRSYEISQDLTRSFEISQDLMRSHKISQDLMRSYKISRDLIIIEIFSYQITCSILELYSRMEASFALLWIWQMSAGVFLTTL